MPTALRKKQCLSLALLLGFAFVTGSALRAEVPFTIQGPGVNAADFRLTTFATELNYPVGMAELSDGSLLVAVSNGSSFFGSSSGSLVRLVDTDRDGLADERSTLFSNVPGGGLSSMRTIDDLIFTTGQGSGKPIAIFRMGSTPADPVTLVGQIEIEYPGQWLHPHSALAVRATPGQADHYDLFFQLGSRTNAQTTMQSLNMTSDIGLSGSLAGDAVHMVTIRDDGTTITGTNLTQVATGLRNAAGFSFHPVTGDLYLQDNGIDGLVNANEPTSADELNRIPADEIGGQIADFGFAENYTEYRTGTIIGGEGLQPLVAFQPIPPPDGDESEGPNDIAFAPAQFPAALRNGIFVGMHGRFSLGGLANEENPLVFVDLDDNSYFHFIGTDELAIGHLDGLLSTHDSLFVADISPGGGFGNTNSNTGTIYQIKSLVPEPSSATTCCLACVIVGGVLRRVRRRNASCVRRN